MEQVVQVTQGAVTEHKRVPVETGFWLLIFGDLFVFMAMFVAFMVRRFESVETYHVFTAGSLSLNQNIGLINTLLLLTSSYCVVKAFAFFRIGEKALCNRQLILALLGGLGFASSKIYEYWQKIDQGVVVTSSRFYEFYFTFTGVHLLHVIIGLALLLVVLLRQMSAQSIDARDEGFFEGVACYWHMVDMLWLMLFSLFYLIR